MFCYDGYMRHRKTKNKKRSTILEIITKSNHETKKLGAFLAQIEQHQILLKKRSGALVLSLEGDLGSGKTTFVKGFARGFGIRETIQSPTFVIAKIYKIKPSTIRTARTLEHFKNLIHIDAYRIEPKDLPAIGWDEFIKGSRNIVLVEWGDRIRNALPRKTIRICFSHNTKNTRTVRYICQEAR